MIGVARKENHNNINYLTFRPYILYNKHRETKQKCSERNIHHRREFDMKRIKLTSILITISITYLFLMSQSNLNQLSAEKNFSISTKAEGAGTTNFLPFIKNYQRVTTSHYWVLSDPNFYPYVLGQADALEHQPIIQNGNRIIFLISFGQPCQTASGYGAYSYDQYNNCHSTDEFLIYLQNFIDGYCMKMQSIRPGASGQNCGYRYNPTAVPVIFAFGPNNCGSYNCDPNNYPNTVTYTNGQAWGTLIENINGYVVNHGYSYQIFIAGAMDIEGSFNTYAILKVGLMGL
jgi:hypothetical protein